MTLGEGVLISTILLVVFITILLITKHKKWIKTIKVLLFLCVLGALIFAGALKYNKYQNRPFVVQEFQGVKLDSRQVDVTLTKGKPAKINKSYDAEEKECDVRLAYTNEYSDEMLIIYLGGEDKNSLKVESVCSFNGYGYPKLLGLDKYDNEDKIIEKLGEPEYESINKEGTEKMLNYTEWNVAISVKGGRVSSMCATNSEKGMYFNEEYGESDESKEKEDKEKTNNTDETNPC